MLQKLNLDKSTLESILEKCELEMAKMVPSILSSLARMTSETTAIKSSMNSISKPSQEFNKLKETSRVIENMTLTKNALKEAENWSTLSAEMEAIFNSQDYSRAIGRLVEARRSLNLLQHTPDYHSRESILVGFENTLMEKVKPDLIISLSTYSEKLNECVQVYQNLHRMDAFEEIYLKHRVEMLKGAWNALDCESPSTDTDMDDTHFLNRLGSLYKTILECVEKELKLGLADSQFLCDKFLAAFFIFFGESILDLHYKKLRDAIKGPCVISFNSGLHLTHTFANSLELLVKAQTWPRALFGYFVTCQSSYLRWEEEYLVQTLDGLLFKPVENPSLVLDLGSRFLTTSLDPCLSRLRSVTLLAPRDKILGIVERCLGKVVKWIHDSLGKALAFKKSSGMDEQWSRFRSSLKVLKSAIESLESFTLYCSTLRSNLKECDSLFESLEAGNSVPGWSLPGFQVFLKDWYAPLRSKGVLGLPSDGTEFQSIQKEYAMIPLLIQKSLFQTLFEQFESLLAEFSKQEWNGSQKSSDLPTFSLSPLAYMTRIGETLLMLPQQLEQFASQELGFELSQLPFLQASDLTDFESLDDVVVTHLWITALSRCILNRFLDQVRLLNGLSETGSRQILADMSYLSNVLAAMEISPEREWNLLKKALEGQGDSNDIKSLFWVSFISEKRSNSNP